MGTLNKKYHQGLVTAFLLLLLKVTPAASLAKGIQKQVTFDFYGHEIPCKYEIEIENSFNGQLNKAGLDLFVQRISATDYESLKFQLLYYAQKYRLDDIGYCLLLDKFTDQAFKNKSKNFRNLIKWQLLRTDSFDVALGYNTNQSWLMAQLDLEILGTGFIVKDSKRYYSMDFNTGGGRMGNMTLYGFDEANQRKLNLNSDKIPLINARVVTKSFQFNYENTDYLIEGTINRSLTEYYRDLPVVFPGKTFLNFGFSQEVKSTLMKELKGAMAGKTRIKALNLLLAFTQQALPYKNDLEYLGVERYSYPEETLNNVYSDCEDKSLLYALLVKELLGIKSLAIYYPEQQHMNVALQLPETGGYYSFKYKNESFVVCDPTSTGFVVGETGEDFSGIGKIVPLF